MRCLDKAHLGKKQKEQEEAECNNNSIHNS